MENIDGLINTNVIFRTAHEMRLRHGWDEVRFLQELVMAIHRHDRMLAEEYKRQMIEQDNREARVAQEFDK